MQKCDRSTYKNKAEAILMPNNKHQTIMTVYANNRCIYHEHMS